MKKIRFNPKKIKLALPELKRLKYLPKILTKTEKWLFFLFFLGFIVSSVVLIFSCYYQQTTIAPTNGGILREGIVGQPRFINPIYAASNDSDRDLVNLIFSGLFKYDSAGKIIPDLVENYSIEENGKLYDIFLKKDVTFHDKEPLTADDVLFTIRTIQNPDFQSPIQAKWLEVEAEKISEYEITLRLKNSYPAFLETLCLKILPSHVWKNISAQNFPLSPYNFKPIGSGPFSFKDISQDKSGNITTIILEKFPDYYNQLPYLQEISFLFFENEKELSQAAENNIVDSFVSLTANADKKIYNFNDYSFTLPRYFALFFNSKENPSLGESSIKMALNYATDKEELKKEVLFDKGTIVFSPFLPDIYHLTSATSSIYFNIEKAIELFKEAKFIEEDGKLIKMKEAETMHFISTLTSGSRGKTVEYLQECLSKIEGVYPDGEITGYFGSKTKEAVINFQEKYADEILKPSNLTKGNGRVGPGTRKKLNEVCIISPAETIPFEIIVTTTEDPMLLKTAELLKAQWEKIGITIKIESLPISVVKQETIRERNYESLLFGQVLGIVPDPFSFWHSSQKSYPGLNLAGYKNEKVDKLLEDIRTGKDQEALSEKFQKAQEYLMEDMPALFLFNPDFLYLASTRIKGINSHLIAEPSQRFAEIQDWYIKTKREWK